VVGGEEGRTALEEARMARVHTEKRLKGEKRIDVRSRRQS
jgi:hypothetical protein